MFSAREMQFDPDKTRELQVRFNHVSGRWSAHNSWREFRDEARLLIAEGADPEIASEVYSKNTLLISAIHSRDLPFIEFLLDNNVDVVGKNAEYPPVKAALLSGRPDISEKITMALLDQGQESLCRTFNQLMDSYHDINWERGGPSLATFRSSLKAVAERFGQEITPYEQGSRSGLIRKARAIRDYALRCL